MLRHLELKHVGPAREMAADLAPRLNFFTGDNGVGKTFLLDIAWWLMTGTWARQPVVPVNNGAEAPSIRWGFESSGRVGIEFDRHRYGWRYEPPATHTPRGIIIYAQLDGAFALWDHWRNVGLDPWSQAPRGLPPAFLFHAQEVWDGFPEDSPKRLCNGLIQDWALWQEREKGDAFGQLTRVLRQLSPSPEHSLIPGDLRRVSLDDVRDHPTLRMPYGEDVALIHASAGMRRIVALSYLLVWAWQEHKRAAELLDVEPARQIVFLFDEIEAHLHPQWQRRIVPALLDVMKALTEDEVEIQVLGTTHSPLVLASVEPYYQVDRDAVHELALVDDTVRLQRFEWKRLGDVNSWLSSSVFALDEPRSLEAEVALEKATALLRQNPQPSLEDVLPIDAELRDVLSSVDRFWIRWSAMVEDLRKAS